MCGLPVVLEKIVLWKPLTYKSTKNKHQMLPINAYTEKRKLNSGNFIRDCSTFVSTPFCAFQCTKKYSAFTELQHVLPIDKSCGIIVWLTARVMFVVFLLYTSCTCTSTCAWTVHVHVHVHVPYNSTVRTSIHTQPDSMISPMQNLNMNIYMYKKVHVLVCCVWHMPSTRIVLVHNCRIVRLCLVWEHFAEIWCVF